MTERVASTVTLVVLVAVLTSALVGGAALPVSGAAPTVAETSVTPTNVTTGEATTLSLSVTVTGVDTSDGTTGGTVTVTFPDAVDLAGVTVTNPSVGPNATVTSTDLDADAGTLTVSWDDDGGATDDTLTIAVDVADAVVARTGAVALTATIDADAAGGAELKPAVGNVTATATTSDRSVTSAPATLYLGERAVDVTGLPGAKPAGEPQQFFGVAGEAEGTIADASDALAVDVTAANSFESGSYALSPSGDAAVSVVRPQVTDVTLSPGDTASAVDVSNGSIPRGTTQLTAAVETNFAGAENVTLSVTDEAELDVTEQVTDSPTVPSSDSLTLDVADLETGTYSITVEGADDLDSASRTVSVRIRDEEKVVSVSKTRVVQGASTIVSVAGAPGDIRYVRIDATALREETAVNTPTARAVFDDTAAVQTVGADADRGVVYAVVSLDDDGFADVRFQTDRLNTGRVDIELATSLDAAAEDEATLDVTERRLAVDGISEAVVGTPVTVSGTAVESERVKLYAAIDDSYVPLVDEGGDLAEPEVAGDGTWTVDVDTARVVDLPGTYRVVAVGDPGPSRLGSTAELTSETLRTLDPRGSASLSTREGSLSLDASRATIAATGDDEFTLSGMALGQGEDVRLYHVGPRGSADVTVVDERDGNFERTVAGVDVRGTHTYVVVGVGRDGAYAHSPDGPALDSLLSGRETKPAALAKLTDAYTGAGSDDRLARVDVRAVNERLSVAVPSENDSVGSDTLPVSGRSASEDGSTVFVELLGTDGTAVRFAEATVTNGTWNATLDLTDVPPGTYRLSAETAETRASLRMRVMGTETSTTSADATASARESVNEDEPASGTTAAATDSDDRVTNTATDARTPVETGSPATTATEFPGFGVVVGLTALFSLTLLCRRQSARDADADDY